MVMPRESAKGGVEVGRFIQENDAAICQPAIIGLPSLTLSHYLVSAHHRGSGEKPKQTQLREAAETEAGLLSQSLEPRARNSMVDVSAIRQRDPDVDIREKG
jgi:hypothetical protein